MMEQLDKLRKDNGKLLRKLFNATLENDLLQIAEKHRHMVRGMLNSAKLELVGDVISVDDKTIRHYLNSLIQRSPYLANVKALTEKKTFKQMTISEKTQLFNCDQALYQKLKKQNIQTL